MRDQRKLFWVLVFKLLAKKTSSSFSHFAFYCSWGWFALKGVSKHSPMPVNDPRYSNHKEPPQETLETRIHSQQQDTAKIWVNDMKCMNDRMTSEDVELTWIGFGILVLIRGHHRSSTTDFTRQQARNPSIPANLPNPLSFTPPNGRDCISLFRRKVEKGRNLKRNMKKGMPGRGMALTK